MYLVLLMGFVGGLIIVGTLLRTIRGAGDAQIGPQQAGTSPVVTALYLCLPAPTTGPRLGDCVSTALSPFPQASRWLPSCPSRTAAPTSPPPATSASTAREVSTGGCTHTLRRQRSRHRMHACNTAMSTADFIPHRWTFLLPRVPPVPSMHRTRVTAAPLPTITRSSPLPQALTPTSSTAPSRTRGTSPPACAPSGRGTTRTCRYGRTAALCAWGNRKLGRRLSLSYVLPPVVVPPLLNR